VILDSYAEKNRLPKCTQPISLSDTQNHLAWKFIANVLVFSERETFAFEIPFVTLEYFEKFKMASKMATKIEIS